MRNVKSVILSISHLRWSSLLPIAKAIFESRFKWINIKFVTPLLLLIVMQSFSTFFEYNRELISHGQGWRLISAHFVHSSWLHGLFNAVAAITMAWLFAPLYSMRGWILLLLVLSLTVSLGLLIFCPHLAVYCGLSGILHGVFIIGVFHGLAAGEKIYFIAVAALLFKLWREWSYLFAAHYYSVVIDAIVVVEAHFFGLIVGVAIYSVPILKHLALQLKLQSAK